MADFGQLVINAFNELTPDINGIYQQAHSKTLSDWRGAQTAMVAGSGAAAVVIPGLHLAGMAADVIFLMNRMAVCSYGIGAIRGYDTLRDNILEDEDFAVVLAHWTGEVDIRSAFSAKCAADLATKVGGKFGAKLIAKELAKGAGLLIGKKIGGKLGAKLGVKFGAKMGGKAVAGFIPFLGAVVGGGINVYFISEIANAADEYYEQKVDFARLYLK